MLPFFMVDRPSNSMVQDLSSEAAGSLLTSTQSSMVASILACQRVGEASPAFLIIRVGAV